MAFSFGPGALLLVCLAAATLATETMLGRRGWMMSDWRAMRWFWAGGVLVVLLIAVPGYLIHVGLAWKRHRAG